MLAGDDYHLCVPKSRLCVLEVTLFARNDEVRPRVVTAIDSRVLVNNLREKLLTAHPDCCATVSHDEETLNFLYHLALI